MSKDKMKLWLEIAIDILDKIFSTLCHEKRIEKAQELQEIMRQLIIFSNGLRKK